ncbi:hypothetical protein JCM3766R1_004353 [Sporobolomyces carnicolor]
MPPPVASLDTVQLQAPVPDASDRPDASSEVASRSNNNNPDDHGNEIDDSEALRAQLDEKWRIYEMVSEEYHDIVTELPLDYQRTFMLLKELDDEQTSSTQNLAATLRRHLDAKTTAKAADYDAIQSSYLATTRACEDKVNLALTLYESIDRHIQRLDNDLAMYEDNLLIGLRDGTLPSNDAPSKLHNATNAAAASSSSSPFAGPPRTNRDEAQEFVEREHEKEWSKIQGFVKANEREANKLRQVTGVIGMPIDPNEPTYCYCNRVAFGEMVGCENTDCPREWFHLECLGMDKAPAGEWYCRECSSQSQGGASSPRSGGPVSAATATSSSPLKTDPKVEQRGDKGSDKKAAKKRKKEDKARRRDKGKEKESLQHEGEPSSTTKKRKLDKRDEEVEEEEDDDDDDQDGGRREEGDRGRDKKKRKKDRPKGKKKKE